MTAEAPGLDPIEETSLMVACFRAAESRRPDALVRDPFAVEIAETRLGAAKRAQYTGSPLFATTVDLLACRTRVLDERLLAWAVSEDPPGIDQLVNLGAGVDSRPYRLPFPPGTAIFPVDSAAVVAWAAGFFGHRPALARVVPVAADLGDPADLLGRLAGAGVQLSRPVGWVLEGVLEFLGRSVAPGLLAALTAAAAPGSRLIAAVLDPALVAFARERGDAGFPWKRLVSLETVLSWLSGWDLSVLSGEAMEARFGREVAGLFHIVEGRRLP
ncbi:MAG TPA: SAM-dependent methyltransferase [Thermoanaerobaculia bacterium]|nr:SAM-dependent methyltransferase [Thermoanaerobaculia bacterium]